MTNILVVVVLVVIALALLGEHTTLANQFFPPRTHPHVKIPTPPRPHKRSSSPASAPVQVPLFVSTNQAYIMVSLGSPTPQEVLVLVDSGSSTFAVPKGIPACQPAPACVTPCESDPAESCSPPVGFNNSGACVCAPVACAGPNNNQAYPLCTMPVVDYHGGNCVYGQYEPSLSTTSSLLAIGGTCCASAPCQVVAIYGDSSGYEGLVVQDTWTMGGIGALVPFVEITTVQSGDTFFEEAPAGGILGIAYDSINSFTATSLANAYNCSANKCSSSTVGATTAWLTNAGLPDIITMCFNSNTTAGFGIMTFGGEPTDVVFNYAAVVDDSFYVVQIVSISVGIGATSVFTNQTALNEGQSIVDTGNGGLLYMSGDAYNGVCGSNGVASKQSCTSNTDCIFNIQMQEYSSTDTAISLPISGAGVCGHNGFCACSQNVQAASSLVVGFLAMRGMTLVFDRENDRIGFGSQLCNPPCNLFMSQATCAIEHHLCSWDTVHNMCIPTPTPAPPTPPTAAPSGSSSSSSSSFNKTAFLVVLPLMLGLSIGASFFAYHIYMKKRGGGVVGGNSYSNLQNGDY